LAARRAASFAGSTGCCLKKSMAGAGHARAFDVPGEGEWYITAVSVYGVRRHPWAIMPTLTVEELE